MSVAEQPHDPHLVVLEHEDGLRRALPVPAVEKLTGIEATDEEWANFYKAISDR